MGLSDLPKFVPLEEAANRYNVDPQVLDQAMEDGTVRAVRVGESLLVDDHDVAIITVQTQEICQNEDELISINEAAKRLRVPAGTVWQWQERGWLPMEAPGRGRAKLVSWTRAQALSEIREARGRQRLIPRSKDLGHRKVMS